MEAHSRSHTDLNARVDLEEKVARTAAPVGRHKKLDGGCVLQAGARTKTQRILGELHTQVVRQLQAWRHLDHFLLVLDEREERRSATKEIGPGGVGGRGRVAWGGAAQAGLRVLGERAWWRSCVCSPSHPPQRAPLWVSDEQEEFARVSALGRALLGHCSRGRPGP